MNELQFTNTARQLVADFSNEKNEQQLKAEEVYVVWACKTLQNNKALLSTNIPDGRYYEVTYNGDKDEIYFDSYLKKKILSLLRKNNFKTLGIPWVFF